MDCPKLQSSAFGEESNQNYNVGVGNPVLPTFISTQKMSLSDQAFYLMAFITFTTSVAFTSMVIAAVPTLSIHPVLMLIGFIILGGEAIMSYKSLPLRKEVKKVVHLVLHAIALILGIIGIYAAFKYHNESSIANLYSLHSWLGIGIIVLYGIQVFLFFRMVLFVDKRLQKSVLLIRLWRLRETFPTK